MNDIHKRIADWADRRAANDKEAGKILHRMTQGVELDEVMQKRLSNWLEERVALDELQIELARYG